MKNIDNVTLTKAFKHLFLFICLVQMLFTVPSSALASVGYFNESELSVASKSLGITNLGLAGETVKGPAFQPIEVGSWAEYQRYFGGTSTEKYSGSQYPKYELPYIAKTYLLNHHREEQYTSIDEGYFNNYK